MPQPWTEELLLDDRRQVVVRPIDPADAEPLRYGFSLLSQEEVRMRFLHPMSELTPALARQLTHLDGRRDFALVVAEPLPPGQALIGAVVRVSLDPVSLDPVSFDPVSPGAVSPGAISSGVVSSRAVSSAAVSSGAASPGASAPGAVPSRLGSRKAEFAIIVGRILTGQGLGRLLMRKAIRWARLKRLDELYGDVLADNGQMLALVRELGFRIEPLAGERGVMRVRLALRGPAATGSPV